MRIKRCIQEFFRRAGLLPSKQVPQCDFCKREIFRAPYLRLCKDCQTALPVHGEFRCEKCGRKTRSSGLCLACKATPPEFTRGVSAFSYEGNVCQPINAFKNGDGYLAKYFGDALCVSVFQTFETLRKEYGAGASVEEFLSACVIVAVPLDKTRLRERGYNQADLLARQVAKKTGLIYEQDVLSKKKQVASQKHETAKSRAENVFRIYRVEKRSICKGKHVFVVDDIMTTGATGSECARILKNAGASTVTFFSVASAPDKG